MRKLIFLGLLCFIGSGLSCPVFCSCMFTYTSDGVQYIWHCGYQELSNDKLDLILQDQNVSDVNQLYLDGNKITSFDTNKLSKFSKLKHLFLSGNSITNIPSNLFKDIPLLQNLSLANNSISVIAANIFLNANKLKSLNLSRNSIHFLTKNMFAGLSNLDTLDISQNGIHGNFDNALHGLGNLKVLNIKNNLIKKLPARFFDGLTRIEKLDLSGNQLTMIRKDLFVSLAHLKHITFSKNSIKLVEEKSFQGLTLEELDLSNNKISEISQNVFLKSTAKLVNLKNNPLVCGCKLRDMILVFNYNTTFIMHEDFEVSGTCSMLEKVNRQLPLANLTSILNCDFDCTTDLSCKNNGQCVVVKLTPDNTFAYQCQCSKDYEGETCALKKKKSKTKWVIGVIVGIPLGGVLLGLFLFYRQHKIRRQRSADRSPLTDEDFAL